MLQKDKPKERTELSCRPLARTEGRIAKQFDKESKPSATLLWAQQDRLENWRLLHLAGIK